ncbi:HAD family hydrolase [Corynebacterium sputi]|uniref:HAD family hydrolase n=1 Tax=Corynebacterium sputi TaxID=489915 RepID=UPI0003FEB13C|nr:HAD family hydrolase [Corynebacterium sputi]
MTDTHLSEPTFPDSADLPEHIDLVVVDMDGTLLDGDGNLPSGLQDLLEQLRDNGTSFVPASGRQLATLRNLFAGLDPTPDTFLAENGAVIADGDSTIVADSMDQAVVDRIIDTVRDSGLDNGLVVCHPDRAYVERSDEAFLKEVGKYYHEHTVVEDLHGVEGDVVKLAIFDVDDAETSTWPVLREAAKPELRPALSGAHWVDVMMPSVDKGKSLRKLAEHRGINMDGVVVFGDYLNDLQMIEAGGLSFAMANGHGDIIAAADYVAPANTENGVVTTTKRLISE